MVSQGFEAAYQQSNQMLLCKELILIRGQPPKQRGSLRVTLKRGEFK